MGMRKAEEIKAEAETLALPDEWRKAFMLLLEVFLDLREKLDTIESMTIHTESHTEKLMERFR